MTRIEIFAQISSWLVLFFVLYATVTGHIRFEAAAFGGLLLLGFFGVVKPTLLFAGFASPALFTIIAVLIMSDGLVHSGVLTGLGQFIAGQVQTVHKQILSVSVSAGFLSMFMNNVGAIGLIMPTSKRMAARAHQNEAAFGMPLAYASILGGSITLIGTASNLIVSTFRLSAYGKPFRMFDFSVHGLILAGTGLSVCLLRRLLRKRSKSIPKAPISETKQIPDDLQPPVPRSTKNTWIIVCSLLPAIAITGTGIVHPSVAFGLCVFLWIITGVYSVKKAYRAINVRIFLFLGSMLSLSGILTATGALQTVIDYLLPTLENLPPFWLVLSILGISAVFANILNNTVSAVLMAPAVIVLYNSGLFAVNPDILLMAVAAGASMGIVLPTHQAAIVSMTSTHFSRKDYMITGAVIAVIGGVLATLAIQLIWK